MSKNKLEADVGQQKLKKGQDFQVEAKIGGGKSTVVVKFANPEQVELHRKLLEEHATAENIKLEVGLIAA
jgi:hypothetical protein